jgi:hypothetical protein
VSNGVKPKPLSLRRLDLSIEFVGEKSGAKLKTLDLRASKAGKNTWIEANARNPVTTVDTTRRLARMVRDIIADKKLKFANPVYSPGLIVADISSADHQGNETGTSPQIKLRSSLCDPFPNGGFLYRLYNYPEWSTFAENNGNIVAFMVDEFSRIDRSRYHVLQCLITLTRRAFNPDFRFETRR